MKRKRARCIVYIDGMRLHDCRAVDKVDGERIRCESYAKWTVDDFRLCEGHAKKRCLGIVRQTNKRLRSGSAALKMVWDMDQL